MAPLIGSALGGFITTTCAAFFPANTHAAEETPTTSCLWARISRFIGQNDSGRFPVAPPIWAGVNKIAAIPVLSVSAIHLAGIDHGSPTTETGQRNQQ